MADVQLEHGYTRIANEILDNIMKLPLNGSEFRILIAIWRNTYGFNRKEAALSETYLAKATGVSKRFVSSGINDLIKKKIIFITHAATFATPQTISFNKNFELWCEGVQQVNDPSTVEEVFTSTDEQSFNTTDERSFHQEKTYFKDSIKNSMSEAPAPDSPTAIELILNDKSAYPISQKQIDEWSALYPAVDTMQELRKMKGWLDANPTKRKTKRGIMRFITGWLAREQDRGPRQGNQNERSIPYLT